MNRREIKQSLLAKKQRAADITRDIQQARLCGTLTKESLQTAFHRYVQVKFLLEEDDTATRSLEEMANESLARARMGIIPVDESASRSPTCSGASSKDMKIALLIMTAQKEFSASINGMDAAFASTTDDLADLFFNAMKCADQNR